MTPVEIKVELLKLGLTQRDIARRLGCSQSLVYLVVHQKGVSRRVMQALAEVLGLDVATVFPGYFEKPSRK